MIYKEPQLDKAKTMARSAGRLVALAAILALSACDDAARRPAAADASAEPAASAQSDFAAPPRIASVAAGPGGSAVVSGSATPDSRIRAVTSDQATYGATAGHDGRFVLELPLQGRSRLVALSVESSDNRSTRATGWLFVPPDAPERAVLLKAGAAAGPLAGAGLVATVDYDRGGGVAVSGRAQPNASVALAVDGGPAQEAQADPSGVWSIRLALDRALAGPHVLHVRSGAAREDRTVVLAARSVPGVFEAVRERDDWRVDWTPPGGGSQTTLVVVASQNSASENPAGGTSGSGAS